MIKTFTILLLLVAVSLATLKEAVAVEKAKQCSSSSEPEEPTLKRKITLNRRYRDDSLSPPPTPQTIQKGGKRYRSDYKFYSDADGWFKLNQVPANWHEARLRCHLEGGKLASPLNRQMSLAMKGLMEMKGLKDCGIFTGIHATFSRGDFFSVEGTPLARIPHRWADGEPDNDNDSEQCLVMLKDETLADASCHQPLPYVCYRKKEAGQLLNACGTFDNGYSLDARTGSCYKFHTVARTWSRAYMTCAAEGGHLVVINSDTEATVVRELFAKFPPHLIPTRAPFGKVIVFVGFHDWNEHGEWLTIHGDTLEQAGYSSFQGGEPNNATAGEFCGGVYRSGKLDDLWCENNYSFICEKAPDSLLWGEKPRPEDE